MRAPAFTETMQALRDGILAVMLGGLLSACSAADAGPMPTDGDEMGGAYVITPASPEATGGAAGSSIAATGGAGADGIGAGGESYDTGGAAGAGVDDFGAGGMPGEGTGGFDTGGTLGEGTGGIGAGGMEGTGTVVNNQVVCNPIASGTSTVVVNGVTRTFSVQMPANTSHMALLFLWHGWMQLPSEFTNTIVYDPPASRWVPFDPNAFPMPLMIVTPYDTKLIPPAGLDWDIPNGDLDFPFFEGMLQCIKEQYSIDENRIYSMGFSAGAVFTNLLSAKYPNLFAATISESGAWFNDQTQWSDVSIPIIQWQWPGFNPADRGNVLLTHGGPNDYATVISLESTNLKALPYLRNHGRTVVECAHTFGHTLDPDLTQRMYYDYMWAHQLGGPPLAGLPPGFPTHDRPVGATRCTFHPAP